MSAPDRWIAKMIPEGKGWALDLGGGTGTLMPAVEKKGYQYVNLDLHPGRNDFRSEVRRLLRHPLISSVGFLAAAQYVASGLGFVTSMVAARMLGPTDYGVAALVMAYPMLLWSFVATKPISVTIRYLSSFRATGQNEELKSICKLGFGLDFLAAMLAFLLVVMTGWWVVRHVYSMPQISWLMVVYAASFPFFAVIGTGRAILSASQRFRALSVFDVSHPGIKLVLMLVFLFAGCGVPGMVIATAIGQATIGVAMMLTATYVLYRDGLGFWWSGSLKSIRPLWKELTVFFGWNYLTVSLTGLMGQVPLMLLGRLRGPEEAGFYRLATSLMTVGTYLETSIGQVVYPTLAVRWDAGERVSLSETLKRWTLRGGLPIAALVALTIPLLPIVVPVVFGPSYSPMILGAQVMMVGSVVSAAFFWLNSFCYASGKIGLWTKAYGLLTALILGLAWFCIQQWGFPGLAGLVAVARVVFTVLLVLSLVSAWKKWG